MAKRPNPELVRYVEKHLAKGFKIHHIKRKLAEVGHPIEAIEDASQFVLAKQQGKRVPKFMIVYGIILILVIAAVGWFIWFKATQQVEYTKTVEEIKKNVSYQGMSDVELIKMAASSDSLEPCSFIKGHNLYYACIDRYWDRGDCIYEGIIGEDVNGCWLKKARDTGDSSYCLRISGLGEDVCLFELADKTGDYIKCRSNDACLEKFALQEKSVEACRAILEASMHETCFDTLALENKDRSLCAEGGALCELSFITSSEEQIAYVEEKISSEYAGVRFDRSMIFADNKTVFITNAAFKTLNADMCLLLDDTRTDLTADLKDIPIKVACLVKVAYLKKDVSVCSKIETQKERNICEDVVLNGCTGSAEPVCKRLEA